MGPITRRSTRSQTESAKEPPKKKTPTKKEKRQQNQPRIDQSLKSSRTPNRRQNNKGFDSQSSISSSVSDVAESIGILLEATDAKSVAPRNARRVPSISVAESSSVTGASPQSLMSSTVASPLSLASTSSTPRRRIRRSKEEEQQLLKDFDLNGLYGACRGISRLRRYQRAIQYKLKPEPPAEILEILEDNLGDKEYNTCIWDKYNLLRNTAINF